MNILFLNASPRRGGNIEQMLGEMVEEARDHGAEIREVRVSRLSVAPCRGCMACRSSLSCVLPEDGAQQVLELINWCDAMVIGAPCYWGNMPGALKMLFDRIVYGMMGENKWGIPLPLHKGKRAVVVSTSTTRWPFNLWFNQTRGVVRALHEILKYSGFRLVATVQKGNTKASHRLTDRERKACRRAAVKLMGR